MIRLLTIFVAPLIAAGVAETPSSPTQGGLHWKNELVELKTTFGQESATGIFAFANQSSHAIEIVGTETSCGCTVANLTKKTYQPGESGVLTAHFDIGQRMGLQEKGVRVATEENGQSMEYSLVLRVDIPQPVIIAPRIRIWKKGEVPEGKTIEITFHEDLPVKLESLLGLNKDSDAFDYRIVEKEEKHKYAIVLKPKSTERAARGRFSIEAPDEGFEFLKNFPIYAFVR